MTKREFLNAVIETVAVEELKDFAKAEIEKMDARNAKRASTPSKKALANEPIKQEIIGFITGKEVPQIASEIATALGISTQKSSALCGQLVEIGTLNVEDVKIKGKGKVKGYTLAQSLPLGTDESLSHFYNSWPNIRSGAAGRRKKNQNFFQKSIDK